jgi:predicted Zn-dependent protease
MNSDQAVGPPDSHHLAAAEGWIGLGNQVEAEQELKQISAKLSSHPDVLRVRYHLYESAKRWELAAEIAQALCKTLPGVAFGWVHLAYALHELKRTREAYNVLHPVANRFPDELIVRYNLACYACQLGEPAEAWSWLEKAIGLASVSEVKKMALADPDLASLRAEIEKL